MTILRCGMAGCDSFDHQYITIYQTLAGLQGDALLQTLKCHIPLDDGVEAKSNQRPPGHIA